MTKGRTALTSAGLITLATLICIWPADAQKPGAVIPHGQDQLPGPALSPAEAIKKMTVPEGFTVELVASEPAIVNPVAMTFDERGRIWITESLEYPRSSAGPGRDRIKILESTKGDGVYDKVTVFAEGLNIPSGIAVGHGGVWVANAPDILFYQEVDGKAAGKPEVVVTGFGRSDTHELPNSLTWGPDGWLYGLNGVFNFSHVKQNGKDFRFTCAMFRIHPKTRAFQLFCEGTSNPWGIAWDNEGSAFVSACVIDHLWHLTETGYYHRQGGPYPPFTWQLESIVKHKHQKAAYCGLHFFDSDAYPPEYREKLYMGNIHGGCVNSDELTRAGSSYFGKPQPDFLTAHDPWFMPVAQKTGPDGCLYILDWYDRYHCYQDARRDPAGIDRLNGRLYRVRYKNTPRAGRFDLAKETDDQLIGRLRSPNVFFRDLAQRLLCERNHADVRAKLERLILDDKEPRKARMHALWSLIGTGILEPTFHLQLLSHADPAYRAWGVRAAGNFGKVAPAVRDKIVALAQDASPDVKLQVAIAARKVEGVDPLPVLMEVLTSGGDDKLIPNIVWQNLHPLLEPESTRFLKTLEKHLKNNPSSLKAVLPRVVDRLLASPKGDPAVADLLLMLVGRKGDSAVADLLMVLMGRYDYQNDYRVVLATRECINVLCDKVHTGELTGPRLKALAERLEPLLRKHAGDNVNLAILDTTLTGRSREDVRLCLTYPHNTDTLRLRALEALITARDPKLLDEVAEILSHPESSRSGSGGSGDFIRPTLGSLGRLGDPRVAEVVLAHYAKLDAELKPVAIDLLTQRAAWSKQLLRAIGRKEVAANALNVNQVRRLLASKDPDLAKQVRAGWGSLREERNPEREQVVKEMKDFLRKTKGDAAAGAGVFKNVCGQCHKIYGEGQDVGPDITANGRSDFDQLLSNVFDPSLVIGAGYQAVIVSTTKGQIITGLVVEDNAQRVVLKLQGGKLETVPRGDVEQMSVSKISLMPEGLEKQLKPREIADLFAFLTLDKPPSDKTARRIPGSPK